MVPTLRPFVRLALLGAACVFARAAPPADDPALQAALADTVLQIGDWKVSRYTLEKQRAKFRAGNPRPAPAETHWLETFVVREVLTAKLAVRGELERAEVRATVERMERHMLSQVDGPLYLRLAAAQPLDEARLSAMQADSGLVVDARIARLPDEATAARVLGPDFPTLTSEEKSARLTAVAGRDDVLLFEGAQPWPFSPYLEIRDAVARAPRLEWVQTRSADGAVFWIWVRTRSAMPAPGGSAAWSGFRPFAERVLRQELRIRRRAEALRTSEFTFARETGRRLLPDLRATENGAPAARPRAEAAASEEELFRYRWQGATIVVSVAEFLRRRDELLVRPATRTLFDLTRLAEDMVLREFDVAEARALGVPESPQFVEDRRAFAGAEALVLHEREVLRPRLAPTPEEIAARYRDQPARFQRTTRVRGRLFVLRPDAAATRWLAAPDAAPIPEASVLSSESVEFERGQPIPGLELFSESMFQGADERHFGPGRRAEGILMFRREAAVKSEAVPLAEAASTIREEMLRERLPAHEHALAVEICRELGVVDRLDLAALRLAGTPHFPWEQ